MTYCKNCGHESHCGVVLKHDEPWPTSGGSRQELYYNEKLNEVCKYCRCGKCMRPDWG